MKTSAQRRWQETRQLLQEALQEWDSLKPKVLEAPEGALTSPDATPEKLQDEKLQELFLQLQEKIKNLS